MTDAEEIRPGASWHGADTLLIMASAKAYKPDMDRARTLGADHFVVKPFRCDDLKALVEAGATVATQ